MTALGGTGRGESQKTGSCLVRPRPPAKRVTMTIGLGHPVGGARSEGRGQTAGQAESPADGAWLGFRRARPSTPRVTRNVGLGRLVGVARGGAELHGRGADGAGGVASLAREGG